MQYTDKGSDAGAPSCDSYLLPMHALPSVQKRSGDTHIDKARHIYNSPLHASLSAVQIGEGGREGQKEGGRERSREEIGLGSQQSSIQLRPECIASSLLTLRPLLVKLYKKKSAISGKLMAQMVLNKRLRNVITRSSCMMRNEGWADFRWSYCILTQSGATRWRAKGQTEHPSIKCLFSLQLIDVSLFCDPCQRTLKVLIASRWWTLEIWPPTQRSVSLHQRSTFHTSLTPSPFRAGAGYRFNITASTCDTVL